MTITKKTVSMILAVLMLASLIGSASAVLAGGGNKAENIEVDDVYVDSTNVNIYCSEYGNSYYRYEFPLVYSVQLEDGSWLNGTGNKVWYDGEYHDIAIYGETQDQRVWRPGGTYRLVAMIDRSATCEFYAHVASEKALSVEIEDRYVIAGMSEYPDTSMEGEQFTHYRIAPHQYKVTLADGRTFDSEGSTNVMIDDSVVSPQIFDPQQVKPWKPGETHQVAACLYGCYTTYNVHILENPVKSITVKDLTLIEGFDGYEYGGSFNYNFFPIDYTVTFKDGTVAKPNEYGNVEWNGELYFFNVYTPSEMNDWKAGRTYTVKGEFMGVETTFNVNIVANEYNSFTISGTDELIFTFRKRNGTEDVYHAKHVLPGVLRENVLSCNLLMEEDKMFTVDFVFVGVASPEDIMYDGPFYAITGGLTSNTLYGCKWFKNSFYPGGMGPDPEILLGDLDDSGDIGMKDILVLRKAVAGVGQLTPDQEKAADLDGDGLVTMKDVLMLRKIVAGIIV